VVDGLEFGVAAGAVSVDHDGKGEHFPADPGEVTAQAIGLVEGAGFGPEAALERRGLEPI
jgi:hypothetical protein